MSPGDDAPADGATARTVWVVEPTDYDEYGINGVFDSLEAAKRSEPQVMKWEQVEGDDQGGWWAGSAHLHIYEETVRTLADVAPARKNRSKTA